VAVSAFDLTRQLEELIAALDRRATRAEEASSAAIARDAAALRARAVDRLTELAQHSLRPPHQPSAPCGQSRASRDKNSVSGSSL